MSSTNPCFHDVIEEIAHVRPRCSSVSRAVLNWFFWHCVLNSLVFSLVMRSLAFSITLVISKFEVTNCPFFIYTRPTPDPVSHAQHATSRGSGIPASRSSCSFFVQSGIAALYLPGPSLCLNLFFELALSFYCCAPWLLEWYVVVGRCSIHLV
jgi:hypothetical protein